MVEISRKNVLRPFLVGTLPQQTVENGLPVLNQQHVLAGQSRAANPLVKAKVADGRHQSMVSAS